MMKKLLSVLLFILLFAPTTQAQEPFKVYLPVILSCFNQDNNWRIIQPVATTNYVLNPSAETTGNFIAVNAAVVTRVTTYQHYGLYSYRVQTGAFGDGLQPTLSILSNAIHYVTYRVRGTLPANGLVLSLDGGVNLLSPVLIEKIDSNWSLYGVRFPAAQANGSTSLTFFQNGAGSGDFYLDGIQVEPLNYWTTYCDGTQEGCAWLGPEHAAASERSGASRAGGRSFDFWTQYGFQVQKIIGAGAASHSLGVDSYAILPGGELNSDKIQSREFQIIGKFIAESESDLLENKRALESAFYTGDRQLTRIRFNGSRVQKEIAVRYQSGLEGDLAAFYGNVEIVEDERYMEHALYTEKASIQVVAPYPYWQEVGESAIALDTNDSATFRLVAGRLRSTGQWSALGPPAAPGTAVYTSVLAIAEDVTYIYFGGDFQNFDNIANADYIVRYNKQTGVYSALDVGLNDMVRALVIAPNGDLYIGGEFTNAGGIADADYLTRWDGAAFNAVGVPLAGAAAILSVWALVFDHSGNLIVGGNFTNWNNIANADHIVMWTGSAYSAMGTGGNNLVIGLSVGPDNAIYAAGSFTTMGGVVVNYVAKWINGAWEALDNGVLTSQSAIISPGLVYVGGALGLDPTDEAIRVWNGTSFQALGDGTNNDILSLAYGADGVLYLGGTFTSAGGISLADRVARWNGYAMAHLDIDLPGSPFLWSILASKYVDPVIKQKYDLFISFDTTGTGTYAGLVSPTNGGNVPAYPKIIYERSGGTSATVETLRNETTGRELLLNYALLSGERLTIDLTPTQRSVISSFFGNRPDAILANSDIGTWVLEPGSQDVTSFVAVAGGPTVTAWMLWREAFSGY